MRQFEGLEFRFRSLLMTSLSAAALAGAGPALAAGERPLNLPAGPLEPALAALAAQTGEQLVYAPDLVAGRRATAVSGNLNAETALARMLAGSDVVVTRAGPRVLVLKARAIKAPPIDAAEPAARPFDARRSADPPAAAPVRTAPVEPADVATAAGPTSVAELRVTGTHIRGGSPAAPVVSLDRATLEATGHATVAAALQTLPQTFGGESTEATMAVRADRLSTNSGYSTGVNLRGLGSDSTLVLVNGRRVAGSGNRGDFADLSSLPLIAVDRVEVLLDGASALYGSDAVGGVVNVILKSRLEGGEARVRVGAAEDGPREALAAVALGHDWTGGSLILAYEAYRREALQAEDRPFTATADLRGLGGSDRRDTFSYPGNIVRTDPVTAALVPFWGIPAGQGGVGLRPTDFQPGVINRSNQNAGLDILPDQRRQSAFLALRQDIGPAIELSAEGRYSHRRVKLTNGGIISTLTVGRGNPFFVSPNNAATNQIQYAFNGEFPNPITHVSVESLSTALGASIRLPRDWRADGYGAFAQEIIETRQSGSLQSTILSEALGSTADNPGTPFSAARDGFFNPFAGRPGSNSPATLAAILSGFTQTRYRSRVSTANLLADGPLLSLPAGKLQLAVGVQARRESFALAGSSFSSGVAPNNVTPFGADRSVLSAYGELRAPLIGPDNRRPGVESLDLSAALRLERYSDFGTTLNPRVGLQWAPVDGLLVRGTFGQSFRAPALIELYSRRVNGPVQLSIGDVRVRSLAKQGGNPDLGPETADTWTLGAEIRPRAIAGLRLSATWFSTEFENRIDRPLVNARTTALTDPRLAPFVQRISPATNAADLALITALIADPVTTTSQGVFVPTDFGAIIDQRYVNTAGLKVQGVDVLASYAFSGLGGRFGLSANGAWILDYKQAITPASPFVEAVGEPGFPARFRARTAVDWTRGSMSLGLAANHVGGFEDEAGVKIRSQTTVDLQARYTAPADTPLAGVSATLSIRNLFDRAPPFYDNASGFGFDAASGDAIGRFVSLQLAKSW